MENNQALTKQAKLRFDFIGMVFALAIGQVGIEVAFYYSNNLSLLTFPYVLSQLVLATYIIASSWVGWQNSTSQGNLESIRTLFGKPFLILLVDLFLVICYFILVKGVEKPVENSQVVPDSKFEAFWCLIIMGTYFVWDLFTKLIRFKNHSFQLVFDFQYYIKRGYQALMCFVMILLVYFYMTEETSVYHVLIVDCILLVIFIVFRGYKDDIFKAVNTRSKNLKNGLIFWIKVFPLLLIASLTVAYFLGN